MNLFALIFLASVVVSLQFNQLSLIWLISLSSLAALVTVMLRSGPVRLLFIAVLSGIVLVQVTLWSQLSRQLSPENQGVSVTLTGRVVDIPKVNDRRARFRLKVESYESNPAPQRVELLSLSWYGGHNKSIQPGQLWRLTVKLKSPQDLTNPGGFDYVGWLFRQRVHAIGYVVSAPDNQLLATSASIASTRYALASQLAIDARQASHIGLMQALLVGLRHNVSKASWDLLRATGTSHLLAISGLHIGMLAAWGFSIGCLLWWLVWLLYGLRQSDTGIRSHLPFNRMDFAACLSLFAAGVYASLAGFTLPTQRALIMLSVVLLVKFMRRHSDTHTPISLALVVILVYDPLATLSAGFWLSFSAVLILLGIGSLFPDSTRIWQRAVLTHLCMGILMFPLTALFFGQGSLVAPLANLIAIPYVSFLVVPPLMLWLLVAPYSTFAAQQLINLAQLTLSGLLKTLQLLQQWLPAEVSLSEVRPLDFGTLLCAGLLLILPKIRYQRWLIVPFLLPFCWNQAVPVAIDRLNVTVLNVGAGIAVVVRTAEYTLLYGAGDPLRGGRTRAKSVLLPYFRAMDIHRLDKLIIPDDSTDVARLASELDPHMNVVSTLSIQEPTTAAANESCLAGSRWAVGGVEFSVYPTAPQLGSDDSTCILSIKHGYNHIILAADASLTHLDALPPDFKPTPVLMVVQSSDTGTIRPEHLVFSVEQGERREFVHEAAQMRYKIRGVSTYRTDQSGAIEFSFSPAGLIGSPRRYRQSRQRAWHRPM